MTLEPAHRARARRVAVGLSDTSGLLVADVAPGTPAAAAGLARGDLLVAVDGRPTRCACVLGDALDGGRRVLRLELLRGNEPVTGQLRRPDDGPS